MTTGHGQFGFVVSDLHLYTRRSAADEHIDRLRDAAARADFFVLNGDIFDFRWTTLADIEATAAAAERELERVAADFPHCRFFYVMGNHDGLALFGQHLSALAGRVANFSWSPSHLLLGEKLFLHGDRLLTRRVRDPLCRPLSPRPRRKGRTANLAYRALVASGMHRTIADLHSPRWCARRILRALQRHHPRVADRVTDVYFGHSHSPFSNYVYRGVGFHNTGSTIRGMHCNLIEVRT